MHSKNPILLVALLVMLNLGTCFPYIVSIDPYTQECFFEKVKNGSKLGLTFEVIEGGFLDIDLQVLGPDNEEIINRERETNGKVIFAAGKTGTYTYCFSNKMSTLTPKEVMFTVMEIPASTPAIGGDEQGNTTKLTEMIKELSGALLTIRHDQSYMEARDKIHHKINESSNSRVVFWSFFEAFVLVTMAIGQIYYLKRFFEVRRIV